MKPETKFVLEVTKHETSRHLSLNMDERAKVWPCLSCLRLRSMSSPTHVTLRWCTCLLILQKTIVWMLSHLGHLRTGIFRIRNWGGAAVSTLERASRTA